MAIAAGNVRDIRALAKRVHRRWLEYRRRNPGMSVPISDTLSRILEHAPDYRPLRPRSPSRQRPALQNPGVFTLKEVANALDTTVGDLLAEPGHTSIRDLVSRADRRRLREAITLLRDLFDLDDETLTEPETDSDEAKPFIVSAAEFIHRDHDYPEPLHVFVVPEGRASSDPLAIREVFDSRKRIIRVLGDSMEPELQHGWKLVVDTERTIPEEGRLVVIYSSDYGSLLGRWHAEGEVAILRKSNPNVAPIQLLPGDDWTVWGTVTTIVEAPIPVR